MIEVSVVVGLVGLLAAAGWAAATLAWQTLLMAGAACIAAGALLGLPTSAYYHLLLYRFLASNGELPRDWWLHPMRYHSRLDDSQVGRMRPWFNLGAFGFVIMMLGCLIAALGVMIA